MRTASNGQQFQFEYDVLSRKTARVNPNGIVSRYIYDAASQVEEILHRKNNKVVSSINYTRDGVGNVASESRLEGNDRSMVYDANNRILEVLSSQLPQLDEQFSYDGNGNWTPYEGRVHDKANKLIEDDHFIYVYDEEGCLTQKRSRSDLNDLTYYNWNVRNQLKSVQTPDGNVYYQYDALGRRIERNENGVFTQFLYNGNNVSLESDGTDWTYEMTSAGTDRWLSREDLNTGDCLYYHTDGGNSTIALSDDLGDVTERYFYSSYGKVEVWSQDMSRTLSSSSQQFTFAGREYDELAGLYYNRARYYSPTMGRFISEDPIGIAGGLNVYAYANNNPFSFFDPSGLDPQKVDDLVKDLSRLFEELAKLGKLLSQEGDSFWDKAKSNNAEFAENLGHIWEEYKTGEGFLDDFNQEMDLWGDDFLGRLGDYTMALSPELNGVASASSWVKLSDIWRPGNTFVSNQLVVGKGAVGATKTWAIKGGDEALGFHYHIHKYNWRKPQLWFKQTPIIKPPKKIK